MQTLFLGQHSKFLLVAIVLVLAPGRRLAAQSLAQDIQQLVLDY